MKNQKLMSVLIPVDNIYPEKAHQNNINAFKNVNMLDSYVVSIIENQII